MKSFSKKTIALVLASVVTVVGAFGAHNYKNCLRGIDFESSKPGAISVVLQTSSSYAGNTSFLQKDANTYVLTLPEVNSEIKTPDLSKVSNDISSVNVRTMPYSNNAKGYTRITIKTSTPSLNINAVNKIYIASSQPKTSIEDKNATVDRLKNEIIDEQKPIVEQKPIIEEIDVVEEETEEIIEEDVVLEEDLVEESSAVEVVPVNADTDSKPQTEKKDLAHNLYFLLWGFLIVLCSVFFYVKAKNKMFEISGEKLDLNIDDEEKKPEKKEEKLKEIKKIKNTIKELDSTYLSNVPVVNDAYINNAADNIQQNNNLQIVEEEVVDLDELLKSSTLGGNELSKEEEENRALEDFLSGFSFNEFEEPAPKIEEESFDEELYEKIINNKTLVFTKDDILCINKLLGIEINDDTKRNIEKYVIPTPEKKPSKKEVLENLVTTYTITHDVRFSSEDIDTLNKLMSVELSEDFVTDLNVDKDLLSAKKIIEQKEEANVEEESIKEEAPVLKVIKDDYGANILVLDQEMPDLSVEIHKKGAFLPKPSARYEVVDTNYVVGNSIITDVNELPDLADAVKHPEKYERVLETTVVDEKALMKSIEQVQFKPFYDGNESFEVVNKLEDYIIQEQVSIEKNLLEHEFHIEQKNVEKVALEPEIVEEIKKEAIEQEIVQEEKSVPKERKTTTIPKMKEYDKGIFEGESYAIVSSIDFGQSRGCHLAKNEKGYVVFAYVGDNVNRIKQFDYLKNERFQARLNEKFDNGVLRYLVRVGLNKFVIDVKEDSIEYIMDLC